MPIPSIPFRAILSLSVVRLCLCTVWVDRPEDVPLARERILTEFRHKYAAEVRACCERVNSEGQMDCAQLSSLDLEGRPRTLLLDGQEGAVRDFFFQCLAHGRDGRKCCAEKGMPVQCLPLCNAASPPASGVDSLEALLEKCQAHKGTVTKCFHWRWSSRDGGQMHFADQDQGK